MKKPCLHILFFIVLLDYTSLSQLLKFPILVVHFMEHHELDNKIGVIEFLSMHYWGKDLDDHDEDRDMKLPYKKVDFQSVHHIVFPMAKTAMQQYPIRYVSISQPVFKDNDLLQPALASPFRPPKA